MKVFMDEEILLSMTFADTTPESAAEGDNSETGYLWEETLCDMDDLQGYVSEMSELDCGSSMYGEPYTTCYRTGTDRTEALHLGHNATSRMHEIWAAAQAGTIEYIYEDDEPELWDARDEGLPVPYIYMGEFNKVQGKLDLQLGDVK